MMSPEMMIGGNACGADAGLAAVIVNFRTPELTRAAVQSVLSEPGVDEVIVVDNGSADGSAEFLERTFAANPVRIIRSDTNRGYGPGANIGVAETRAPLVLLMNSDATLVPGSLEPMRAELLGDDRLGVVAPAVYGPDGVTLQPRSYGRLPRRREVLFRAWSAKVGRSTPADRDPEWVSGVAMLLRRADFVRVGGFDERFTMYFEDLDLCLRLRTEGGLARRVPSAGVVHMGGRSWQVPSDQIRCFHESKLKYFEKVGAAALDLRCLRVLGRVRTTFARYKARRTEGMAAAPGPGARA